MNNNNKWWICEAILTDPTRSARCRAVRGVLFCASLARDFGAIAMNNGCAIRCDEAT